MKVKVDADLCTGCEDCVNAVPSIFAMGDDDIAVTKVEEVPADQEAAVRSAADECPAAAIEVED